MGSDNGLFRHQVSCSCVCFCTSFELSLLGMASLVGFLQRLRIMPSDRESQAFLAAGPWVPVEAATQLIHQLKVLQAWAETNEPLDSSTELMIRLQLIKIEFLLDLGSYYNILASAKRWKAGAQDIQLLTERLTLHQ
jgi:hypothetical protein